MTKLQPKNTQIRYFWSQTESFLILHQTLQQDNFKDAHFKYDNSIFKFQPKNTQITHFWSQIQALLVFHEILQLERFGVLISNMTILLSNSSLKYPNNAFLVPNLGIFVFSRNFFSRFLFLHQTLQQNKFEDADFKQDNSVFKFHPKNM